MVSRPTTCHCGSASRRCSASRQSLPPLHASNIGMVMRARLQDEWQVVTAPGARSIPLTAPAPKTFVFCNIDRSGSISGRRSSTGCTGSRYKDGQPWEYVVSEEILINVTPRETRVAVVENGMLQEVMPGMQAVFVEIGLERAAFLHASDIVRPPIPAADGQEANGNGHVPSISELVHEGQEIVVQVVKDPISTKGARLSAHLSIPSRYLVLLPYAHTLGISARIEDEAERQRLREVLGPLVGETPLGYIVRTNAEGQGAVALAFDVAYLGKVWRVVQENI